MFQRRRLRRRLLTRRIAIGDQTGCTRRVLVHVDDYGSLSSLCEGAPIRVRAENNFKSCFSVLDGVSGIRVDAGSKRPSESHSAWCLIRQRKSERNKLVSRNGSAVQEMQRV